MHFDMIDHRRLLRAAGAALALGVVMAPAAAKACNPFEFLFGGCRESVRPRPIETIPVEGPIAKPKRKASAGVAHVAKQVAIAPPVGAKVGSVAHFAEDKTLRSGDVVVTPNGFLVYRGHSGARNGDDFQPLAKAPPGTRKLASIITPAIGSSQNESALRRGNAMSGAPSMSGMT